jgi:ATP synthase protein I
VVSPARQFGTVQQHWKSAGSFSTLGLEVALSVVFGLFLGRYLDNKLSTGSVFTVVWFCFGVAAAARAIYRALKRANEEAARAEAEAKRERESYLNGTDRDP